MLGGKPRRLPAIRDEVVFHYFAGHADRQRSLVTGCGAQLTQFVEASFGAATGRPSCVCAQQRTRCDAHRYSIRIVVGQPICDFPRTSPARLGGDIVADV